MKELVGVIKDIDRAGRMVMPKEFRELYSIGNQVEVIPTEEGVLVRNPQYKLVKITKDENPRPIIIVTNSEIQKYSKRKKKDALN